MSTIEDMIKEREERRRRVDLIREDFVEAAVVGLFNLEGFCGGIQENLENRLGFFGFNINTKNEKEMRDSVECLMEMTHDCCISDEDIVDFMLMDEEVRSEWAASRISDCSEWDGSTIFPT